MERIACEICKKEFSRVGLKYHITHSHNITDEQYYITYISKPNKCKMCGIDTKFISLSKGYNTYCSSKCFSNDPEIKEKKKNTSLDRYGFTTPSQSPLVKENIKKTCIEKYGVSSHLKLQRVIDQRKEIILNKYGVDNVSQHEDIKEKKKETCLKNFGVEHPSQSSIVINKMKETMISKYGVENAANISGIEERKKETNLKRYGFEWGAQSDIVKQKIIHTCQKKYGHDYSSQSSIVQDKIKKTNLEKYGIEWNLKSNIVQEKIKKKRVANFSKIIKKITNYLQIELLEEYENDVTINKYKCQKCNNIFLTCWKYIKQNYGKCPLCFPKISGKSKAEIEIYNYIRGLSDSFVVENSCRDLIKNPLTNNKIELDIFLPDINIAIEYNGIYFHSENYIDNKYHLMKTNECEMKGIHLIHIFEDEWILKQEIVKARIKNIIGIKSTTRIHARKCSIKEITSQQKNEFLEQYHIQGKDNASINLGAFYNDKLISAMTFSKGNISKGSHSEEGVWELNRFCSDYNYHVVGIAGKLLAHFKRNYEWKQIFSYADRRWSKGNLYYQLGFKLDHITKPNYWYVKYGKRIHRFNLRKRPEEPKDIPEWALRQSEGFLRIWDCGNLKFSMINERTQE